MMKFLGQNSVQKNFTSSLTKKAVIFLLCLPIAHITLATQAIAEEVNIEISGNGAESSSVSNVTSENSTIVTQNNEANITNNVTANTNTGGNNASHNNGDVAIVTGNTNTTIDVVNSGVNSNNASVNTCCNQSTNISVNGNGAGSNNYVNGSSNNTTDLNQNNAANITNNINVKANTGYNNAIYNNGDVTIVTGKIYSAILVSNKNINNNHGEATSGNGSFNAFIKENGAYSDNLIAFESANNIEINKNNEANIENNVYEILNTGKNYAVGNLGDVVISTGNIESYVKIENENINSNTTVVTCDCKDEVPSEPKPTPPTPHVPGQSVVQGASGSSSDGSSSNGNGLPVTGIGGSSSALYLITLILIMMFLSGMYLRFHSGNAPPEVA